MARSQVLFDFDRVVTVPHTHHVDEQPAMDILFARRLVLSSVDQYQAEMGKHAPI